MAIEMCAASLDCRKVGGGCFIIIPFLVRNGCDLNNDIPISLNLVQLYGPDLNGLATEAGDLLFSKKA